MVKLAIGQVVRTEWESSWWLTSVEAVDASLVKLHFHINDRREWVYRGSTRLGPLFLEFQEQKKLLESGNRATVSRRNVTLNRNRPYIEYTRQTDDDASVDQPIKRAVARKSTATKYHLNKNFPPCQSRSIYTFHFLHS
jgi:histone-lysine N-methyltransferase SETDB1